MNRLTQTFSDLIEFLYPTFCITCGERLISQEKYVCIKCWLDLPVTNFHLNTENIVAQLFWGRIFVENATSLFHYKKGSRYQKIIHYIKYKGMKDLGFEFGIYMGELLYTTEQYYSVDIVVPVALHPDKQRERGYNQSEWIACGIANILKKPVSENNLYRKVYNPTQTRKDRFERWQNVEGIFGVRYPQSFEGRHILLVDDVVTTGSTLEACAFELLKIKNVKVSIATLAYADF